MLAEPRRLGVLVPSADVVVEPNFQRYLPDGVVYYASRSNQKGEQLNGATLDLIVNGAFEAAASLAHAKPELICFCCTAASFIRGPGWDQELAQRISRAAGGIPATTTSTAMIEALKALGARSIFLITPYPEERYQVEIAFFRASGIEVKGHDHFACGMGWEIPAIRPEQIVEKARRHRDAIRGCDALFFSCTNLRSMDVAAAVERELGVPVVTSNQSTLWLALGRLGVDASGVAAGRLFAVPYPKPERFRPAAVGSVS